MNIISLVKRFLKSRHKLLDISCYFHLPYVLAYPNSAGIEVTNLCNLKCPVCENSNIALRNKGQMSLEKFKQIIDELGPHLDDLELHNWGESFLNKDIYKMFNYVRQVAPKCYVYLDTNGHFVDASQLLDSPPDELVFSVDGLDQESYAQYRVNGHFGTVIANLKDCIETRRVRQQAKPKIIVKFICMKHNEHLLSRLPDFVRELGADGFRIELFTSRTVHHAKQFMSTLTSYQKYNPEKLKQGILSPYMKQLSTPCSSIWRTANIYWNGDVVPCCTDYDGKLAWGNVFEQGGFWKVWNSKKAQAMRRQHRTPEYRENISICKECYLMNCTIDGPEEMKEALRKSGRSY